MPSPLTSPTPATDVPVSSPCDTPRSTKPLVPSREETLKLVENGSVDPKRM